VEGKRGRMQRVAVAILWFAISSEREELNSTYIHISLSLSSFIKTKVAVYR